MRIEQEAASTAAILNAGYWVRMYGRAAQSRQRREAFKAMAAAVSAALAVSEADPEPILLAVASALYDARNGRILGT